jgi:glutathione-specific gamma-glutamylcyclotransferase
MKLSAEELALIDSRRVVPEPGRDFFVFAYGSLMWRPDFPFLEIEPATLHGYHRAFCITSTHYRGSRETPGLVLGLDRGGACVGRLYRIAATDARDVAAYLHEREMLTGCYKPTHVTLRLAEHRRQQGVAYVADRAHYQYAGKLGDEAVARIIRHAVGVMGSNREYLRNTVQHLDDMGIAEGRLHHILRLLEGPE